MKAAVDAALAALVAATWLNGAVSLAQITVRFSPEPMAVPAAVIANAKQLGRWQVDLCNDGPMPVTLPIQRVMMAAGPIAFVDNADAALVLTANVRRSGWSRVVRIGSWTLIGLGAAATLVSFRNSGDTASQIRWLKIGAGVSTAGTIIPPLIEAAKTEIPSATPLLSTVRWPLQLAPKGFPSACETDHWFAAKMRNPKPMSVVIP